MMVSERLIARYAELKTEAPDCLLLMQVGSFMQVMGDDARAISAVTGLKLQMGGSVDAPVVLGGFPKSGLDAYVGELARSVHSSNEAVPSVILSRRSPAKGRSARRILARAAPATQAIQATSEINPRASRRCSEVVVQYPSPLHPLSPRMVV